MSGIFATSPLSGRSLASAALVSALLIASGAASQSESLAALAEPATGHAAPVGGFAEAIRAHLTDPALAAVYAARGDMPIWLEAGRGEALLAAMRAAASHALPAARYDSDALAARLASAVTPAERAAAEAASTNAFLRWARDISSGALEPRRIARLIKVDPPRRDPAALLAAVAAAPDVAAHLASLAPADPAYEGLRVEYARLAGIADGGDWGAPVPDGPSLRPGDRDARVPVLRARLSAMGAGAVAEGDSAIYDAALVAAVEAFQRRHGLIEDGVVGPATRDALNTSAAARAGQIAVNLERMRWNNRPLGHRHIVVNQPGFTATLVEGDRRLFHERVVVGRVAEQTPEFSEEMEFLVLNPTWFVPRSIATQDLLPQLQRDPTVLERRNMRLSRPDGGMTPLDPATHDWTIYTAADFPYRIRQAPSEGNALGRVKFMFPNGDNIYLHDTPSKELFQKDVRAFSWGCVRVRDPLRLAELLLAPQEAEPRAVIDRILATGRERRIDLAETVPVHLTYRTAWIDESGALQLRGDVYGRDRLVLEALRAIGVEAPEA